MKDKRKRNIYSVCSVLLLIALDQAAKILAEETLKNQEDLKLIPGILHFHYLENTGGAFSLFENQQLLFLILTPIFIMIFIFIMQRLPQDDKFIILKILLIFLISGAVGNLLDRIGNGFVIDFIYFVPINFPVFNLADIYITVSCFTLVILLLFYYKDDDFEKILASLKKR